MASPVRAPFRLRPPDPSAHLVVRHRLIDALAGRFERRLTVVRGGGGSGKTTLLAQAVAENALDPVGIDAWLQIVGSDARPEQLLDGIAQSVVAATGVAGGGATGGEALDDVVERVWAVAPTPVAILLDDVHLIDGSDSAATLAALCAALPANGHVVIGSRTMPRLPVRSLQARGEATVLDEADLLFTRDELSRFAHLRAVSLAADEIPPWPSLAVLMSTVGRSASAEFLWEAVLGSLESERREALALLVRFGRVDDELVAAVLGGGSAHQLLSGLPLIETVDEEHRFHDLWRTALDGVVPSEQWRPALVAGAEVLAARGEIVRAAACFSEASAGGRVVDLARTFGMAPISAGLSGAIAEALADQLPAPQRTGPLGRYLRTIATSVFQSDHVLDELREIRRRAFEVGDMELATLALWRETQLMGYQAPDRLMDDESRELVDDVERLAIQWPLARCALALIRSHQAEARRDVPSALAALRLFDGVDSDLARTAVTSRYLALGQPELVGVTLEEVLAQGVSDAVSAQAVWLRGEVDPSVALPIVRELPAAYDARRLPNVQVPLLGVLTSVAIAAGDLTWARELADDASALSERLQPRPALFAVVADALVVLAVSGDEAAAQRLGHAAGLVPVEPWPAWAYLGGVCAVRVLVPGTEWLDEIEFGPSIATAVSAGRALVTLRQNGDLGPAAALPWTSPDLLRVHVPPSFLCELAAAVAAEEPAATRCLDMIPGSVRWLRRLVDHRHHGVRTLARARTAGLADRPGYELAMTTFGEFAVRRTDGVPVSERVRGGRVAQLVACLLVDRAPLRTAIASRMWPDLPDKQAAANLRVTLASLLDAIEPDRSAGTSWFVETSDGRLRLGEDDIDVDVRRFDAHATAAREAERSSRLSAALEHHLAALAIARGEFMPGLDDEDVVHERLRLQALAYHSGCRAAELLLARGEPEDALRVALDAARVDQLSERARRTEVRCHLALGSVSGARAAITHLLAALAEEGLSPERETEQLIARLSPSAPAV